MVDTLVDRVTYINLRDSQGGAAIAMNRLVAAIAHNYDIKSEILVGTKTTSASNVIPLRSRWQRGIENRIIERGLSSVGLQYQWFPFSSYNMMKELRKHRPDVINLHLTHSSYFQTSMLPKISTVAPVVWTLHDMWAFTGNSAHTFGDESWKQLKNSSHLTKIYPAIGMNAGSWLLRQKKRIYTKSNITLVTPSQWLRDLASQSPVFKGKRIVHINNGIDLNVFRPGDKLATRKKLDIPDDARVIVFSTAFFKDDTWKGGNHLVEILKRINANISRPVYVLLIGKGGVENISGYSNFIIRQTGYVDDEKLMALYLSACDLFLYPTKADNLPNVLVEAIACGVPAVTFDIGGCREIVVNDYNGIIVKPFDFDAVAAGVVRILTENSEAMSRNARKHAEENFDVNQMARDYMKLFQEVTKR